MKLAHIFIITCTHTCTTSHWNLCASTPKVFGNRYWTFHMCTCGLEGYYCKFFLFNLMQILYLVGVGLLLTFDLVACVDSQGMRILMSRYSSTYIHVLHMSWCLVESWEFASRENITYNLVINLSLRKKLLTCPSQ